MVSDPENWGPKIPNPDLWRALHSPSETNPVCECAGQYICCPCTLRDVLEELASLRALEAAIPILRTAHENQKNRIVHLRAAHTRLLEALRDLDTLMDFDAPADHCPCWPNPGGLNRAMKKARAAIAAAVGDPETRVLKAMDEIDAAIAAAEEAPPVNRWRHRKRGSTYTEVGRGQLQTDQPIHDMEPMVIYRSDSDDSLWARPVVEFEDGRYEAIAAAEGGGND